MAALARPVRLVHSLWRWLTTLSDDQSPHPLGDHLQDLWGLRLTAAGDGMAFLTLVSTTDQRVRVRAA